MTSYFLGIKPKLSSQLARLYPSLMGQASDPGLMWPCPFPHQHAVSHTNATKAQLKATWPLRPTPSSASGAPTCCPHLQRTMLGLSVPALVRTLGLWQVLRALLELALPIFIHLDQTALWGPLLCLAAETLWVHVSQKSRSAFIGRTRSLGGLLRWREGEHTTHSGLSGPRPG